MLKITSFSLCGLLLITATGCQTARSVKETIVNWRPSFHKGEQVEQVAETEKEDEKAQSEIDAALEELQVKTASLNRAAEELEPPSLEEIAEELAEGSTDSEALDFEAELAGSLEDDVEQELSDFEKYQQSLLEKKQEAEQLVADAQEQTEEFISDAEMLIQEEVADSDLSDVDPAFMDTEKLSEEIDALLSDNTPQESSEEQEAAPLENSVADNSDADSTSDEKPVQQAVMNETRDAGDIAFDLASFADSSIADAEAFSEMESHSSNELVTAELEEKADETLQADYPWASDSEKQSEPEKKTEEKQLAEAAVQPEKIKVSEEILQNLERALGDENWRAAGRVRIQSEQTTLHSEEFKQIAELIHNQNAKVRLQGLRLAVQNGKVVPEIVALVESLLNDDDQVVRAHAATTLYQWKQSPERVVETLSSVLSSQNENARQFAAMYLGDMNDQKQKIIPVLETHLLSAQGMTALHLSEALLKLEPANVNAVSRLTALMRDSNVEVRWLSAHALGAVQGELQPYAVEALRGGLRDVDSQVRATSALALGGLGSASQVAVAELNFMLEHGETNVKDAAKIALDCIQ